VKVWVVLFPLLALQLGSGLFLLWDILGSILGIKSSPIAWVYYELAQIGAVIGLILGVVVSATLLLRSIRKQRAAEESLRLASGAFMEVLHERFAEWQLTPAETDVALFSIKGLSTADIAALRNTSEGTVKAQTNAIYRKAGVSGRPQLLSLFIDELMSDTISGGTAQLEPEVVEKAS
jgi:DNA-binding CsgD family transcriptional regulator